MLNMYISATIFFSSTVIEWNKLDNNIRNSESVSAFKNKSLKLSDQFLIVRLMCIIFMELNILQDYELGEVTLHERKFRHNFQDLLDPFCNCGRHIKTTIHVFLHFDKISNIKRSLLNQNDATIVEKIELSQ